MMLITPQQIQNATFTTHHHLLDGDCYNADEVDQLLDQAALSLQIVSQQLLRKEKK